MNFWNVLSLKWNIGTNVSELETCFNLGSCYSFQRAHLAVGLAWTFMVPCFWVIDKMLNEMRLMVDLSSHLPDFFFQAEGFHEQTVFDTVIQTITKSPNYTALQPFSFSFCLQGYIGGLGLMCLWFQINYACYSIFLISYFSDWKF